MKTLDCETRDTTYTSLEDILGVSKSAIDAIFQQLNIEQFYEDHPDSAIEPRDWLFSNISPIPLSTVRLDRVYWFHLTRVPKSTTFLNNGLLPLGQAIDAIWNFLHLLVETKISKEEWAGFRKNLTLSHHARLYRMKIGNPMLWGPYAILVKEVAFNPQEIGNHDYLRTPEIVEDICLCFQEKYGIDLLMLYMANSIPCIVKFMDDIPQNDYVTTALYYLYACYHRHELSLYCNTCLDSRGISVKPERIAKVEWL